MQYPNTRMHRNRKAQWCRQLVAENALTTNDLIYPIFISSSDKILEIESMPDINILNIKSAVEAAEKAYSLGILAIAIFPRIAEELKTNDGREALNENSIVYKVVKAIKHAVPDIGIICDVALDPYTLHGHDGIINTVTNKILNDETVSILCEQALMLANAGCDAVAPSDMMDGRVGKIRNILEKNNFFDVQIIPYSVKYASCFYTPFRKAVGSVRPKGIDKRSYYVDFANSKEAMTEVDLDIKEGADAIIIKPGIAYLDIIARVTQKYNIPVFTYQVSGEYALIKFGAKHGVIDEYDAFMETLTSFKRAGASSIITYAALNIAQFLHKR